eukprot:4534639-Pleurochrysis_carterae.AAC.1
MALRSDLGAILSLARCFRGFISAAPHARFLNGRRATTTSFYAFIFIVPLISNVGLSVGIRFGVVRGACSQPKLLSEA